MASERPSEREILARALAPGKNCPPIERLEACLDAGAPAKLMQHLESCGYCQAELELLRSFHAPPRDAAEAEAVRQVSERLRAPRLPIREAAHDSWWRRMMQAPWLSPAAFAAAALMIAVAVGVQWRHSAAPAINAPSQPEQEVMRSGSLAVVAPAGDLKTVPSVLLWQPVANAEQYRVSILEVDHTVLWKTSTSESRVNLPAEVKAKIVPAKTLLLQVTALDGSGRKLAESDFVRFRLLQSVYAR